MGGGPPALSPPPEAYLRRPASRGAPQGPPPRAWRPLACRPENCLLATETPLQKCRGRVGSSSRVGVGGLPSCRRHFRPASCLRKGSQRRPEPLRLQPRGGGRPGGGADPPSGLRREGKMPPTLPGEQDQAEPRRRVPTIRPAVGTAAAPPPTKPDCRISGFKPDRPNLGSGGNQGEGEAPVLPCSAKPSSRYLGLALPSPPTG